MGRDPDTTDPMILNPKGLFNQGCGGIDGQYPGGWQFVRGITMVNRQSAKKKVFYSTILGLLNEKHLKPAGAVGSPPSYRQTMVRGASLVTIEINPTTRLRARAQHRHSAGTEQAQ